MAATTTPSISSLLPRLRDAYPDLEFVASDHFAWQPTGSRVVYNEAADDAVWQLLHELGHGLLGHTAYARDIELISMERDAWQRAISVAHDFGLTLPPDTIEAHLDSYRDWLHARSTCPDCQQTGIQTAEKTYTCPHCRTAWSVNDARTCQLRRYRHKK